MSDPKLVEEHTSAFFGTAVVFLGAVAVWNAVNVLLLDITVQQRYTLAMGFLCSMFAVVVVSKVVRDREESRKLVNGIQRARYEEILTSTPAPGLGKF
ncbi:hypothetical protein JL107_02015 [Nakamurella flavida]|uniref:YiaAB two helix domain-containing protein n=1 Tax=Nakamurella flavida TaxID=363630 RepID=A0A938YKP6_9ACTN|nr:hypothetical protein [Nakamurella flavida]MBM9475212.1 hypothetical protein [Nakamurella flavida]MDP9776785.1 hypothetical protein [Nakamurella flavida]